MRRLVLVSLATCGCSRAAAPPPAETSAPTVWVESEPNATPDDRVDSSAWSGVWTEHFPGRPICQDRFTVRTYGPEIAVTSVDCTNEQPYRISEISWDGQTLRFMAEPPDGGVRLRYSVEMQAPGQIVGTANETAITWSRTD